MALTRATKDARETMSGSNEVNVSDTAEGSAVNRRRLLKGAAAVGVGAVAWSSPNIRTLGATPAYATHTPTTAIITLLSDCDSLQANCSGGTCGGTPEWGPASNPGKVYIENINGSGVTATVEVAGCVVTSGGEAKVNPQPAGFFCEVVQIRISNSGNAKTKFNFKTPPDPEAPDGINDPLVFPAVPPANSDAQCSYFICAILVCTAN
jgi:hypothetical protein